MRSPKHMLQQDILHCIFSVTSWSWRPELELGDRLRAMAVCSAWRDCLNPRNWPLESLELDGWDDDDEHLVPWVVSTQPAVKALELTHYKTPQLLMVLLSVPRKVLETLAIEATSQSIWDCLPAIYSFPSLKKLDLDCDEEDWSETVTEVPLDFKALAPLTALEELSVSGWLNVCWEGGPLLPSITRLQFGNAQRVALDTALPSLRELRVYDASTVMLGGKHFQVPRLSSLSLYQVGNEVAVSWSQLGSLRELETRFRDAVVVSGTAQLSALTNLTTLRLGWGQCQGAWDAAHVLLQAAPCSLQSLRLDDWPADRLPPYFLAGLTQLTSLQCGSLAIIPHLSPLKQLQALHFSGQSASSLSVHELAMLSQLASLRRLRFIRRPPEPGVWDLCLTVLQAVLPHGCQVEQGAW